MEYQKTFNLLDHIPNQTSKFRTKYLGKINDESQGTYDEDNQIRFKTSMLRSGLCNYSDVYILVKGTVTVGETSAVGAAANNINKYCASFTNCLSRINKMQIDDADNTDAAIIEYSDKYSETSGILWHYCRDEPAVDGNYAITDFNRANATRNC